MIDPRLVAELRESRLAADRLRVERAQLLERVALLEQETEAQRDFIAYLTRNGQEASL